MIRRLKEIFGGVCGEEEVHDPQRTLYLACTILMFEVLRADMATHEAEFMKIRAHVQQAFGLDLKVTEALMREARAESEDAISLHEVTHAINREYRPEDKKRLIKMLWDIAYADGELDRYEEHTIRKLADWLYVPHRDFMQAKHEAINS